MERIGEKKGIPIGKSRLYTPVTQPLQAELVSQPFNTIRQGIVTNEATKVVSKPDNMIIDRITGDATIQHKGLVITLRSGNGKALKASTHRLLDMLTVALTESGAKSPYVELSLDELMRKCSLKDRKTAYKQARGDLSTIGGTTVTWEQKESGELKSYRFVNISDSGELGKDGVIKFTFGATFFKVLLGYTIMSLHPLYWRLSAKYNPNSPYYFRKIHEHKNMNVGKDNEDIIAVQTLLGASPETKTYEEIKAGNRHITDLTIDRFERDMDALGEALTWEYCHSKGVPLTDEELKGMNYELFTGLLIKIAWRAYPDQTARLEKKAKKIKADERARKRKEAAKKAKQEKAE